MVSICNEILTPVSHGHMFTSAVKYWPEFIAFVEATQKLDVRNNSENERERSNESWQVGVINDESISLQHLGLWRPIIQGQSFGRCTSCWKQKILAW